MKQLVKFFVLGMVIAAPLSTIIIGFVLYKHYHNSSRGSSSYQEKELPRLPLTLTKRAADMDNSLVIQISNNSNDFLELTASQWVPTDANGSFELRNTKTIQIPGNGMVELGWAQGFSFHTHEQIKLEHPLYKTGTWTIE